MSYTYSCLFIVNKAVWHGAQSQGQLADDTCDAWSSDLPMTRGMGSSLINGQLLGQVKPFPCDQRLVVLCVGSKLI